jgi:creatinine amidohydrolase
LLEPFFIFSVLLYHGTVFIRQHVGSYAEQAMPFWSELTHEGFKKAARRTEVVVMVTGALEAHGKHLPLGSDIFHTSYLAEKIAEKTKAIVLPTIPFGESWDFNHNEGTISIHPGTLVEYYVSVLKGIFKHGFRYIVALNGHGGNTPIIKQAAKTATKKGERVVVIVNWWRDLAKSARKLVEESPGGHAAEDETSEVMFVRPELVDMSVAEAHRVETRFEIISGTFREEIFPSAIYGNPLKATEEKGRLIMEQAEEEVTKLINQLERGELPIEKD